jgi:hypothetical protein
MNELPFILRNQEVPRPLWGVLLLGLALLGLWAWRLYRYRQQRRALLAALDAAQGPNPDALLAVLGNDDQPATADTLGFGRVARAVSGLLRNAATGAPYSVVISGNWGSGKSSVMLQIREQLLAPSRAPFRSVGLNVWHYQSGQHLLGGFLRELLRACDYPAYRRRFRWGRFQEMGFRAGFRLGLALFLLGPALLYLSGLLLQTPPLALFSRTHLVELTQLVARWLDGHHLGVLLAPFRLLKLSPQLLHLGDDTQSGPVLPLWSTVLAWLGTLLGLVHTLRTQGGAITELLPLQQFEQAAASADTGFRDQYRQQFSDVLRHAPDDLRIVFFVDDVDRIPGSRVLELLESLNYLVEISRDARARADADARTAARPGQSTKAPVGAVARLYFVLGMHVPEVVRSLADALHTDQYLGSVAEARRHAARYLEKMVDLVVPMPTLAQCEPEQVARLLFGIEDEPSANAEPLAEASAPTPTKVASNRSAAYK